MALTDEDKQWIVLRLEQQRLLLSEQLAAVEIKLLTELQKWVSPIDAATGRTTEAHDELMERLKKQRERLLKRDSGATP